MNSLSKDTFVEGSGTTRSDFSPPSQMVRVCGTGSFLPELSITTEELHEIFSQASIEDRVSGKFKELSWIIEKTGIKGTRFFSDIDRVKGVPVDRKKGDIDLAQLAAEAALNDAGWKATDVDLLLFVTCTEPVDVFSTSATELQYRLGMRLGTRAHALHSGCGGAMVAINEAHNLIATKRVQRVLIVATNDSSRHFYRDAYLRYGSWLSHFIFGDGSGAIALGPAKEGDSDLIIATDSFTSHEELMLVNNIGNNGNSIYLYYIKGREVEIAYQQYMTEVVRRLCSQFTLSLETIDHFIPHQVNLLVLNRFLDTLGMDKSKVEINVDVIGNTASACTLLLFDRARKAGKLKPGEKTMVVAMGAGLHAGGCVVQH